VTSNNRLTPTERLHFVKGFGLIAGPIALAMQLFGLIDLVNFVVLDAMAFALLVVAALIALVTPPILMMFRAERRVWMGLVVVGVALATGSFLGQQIFKQIVSMVS
jgi:hypothetical protein